MSNTFCPECNQDMMLPMKPGWNGRTCPRCGQGLPAPTGRKLSKMIKGKKK